MQRIGRLINIILLLQAYDSLTGSELAQKFGVSQRTIYRDIEALNAWGFKVSAESGPGGGYRLPFGFSIDPSMFTGGEASILGSGSIAIKGFGDFIESHAELETANAKLLSILPDNEKEVVLRSLKYIHFDQSRWYRKYILMDTLKILKKAVIQNRQANIEFYEREDANNKNTKSSLIDSYGLVYKSDTWYLIGYSNSEKKIRRWNLTRITRAELTKNEFHRPPDFSLPEWWTKELESFGKGNIRVLLQIDKASWPRFARFQWKKENRFYDTGSHIVVEMLVDKYEWLLDLVLVNRGNAAVLEPPELRTKIETSAQIILNNHSTKIPINMNRICEKNIVDLEVLSLTNHQLD